MGIRGAHAYTHSISGVSIGELYQIALARKKKRVEADGSTINNSNNNIIIPCIDIDTSWVYRSSGIELENRLSWMLNLSLELCRIGFIVAFICDGTVRHHSKKASIERKAKTQKSVFEGYVKRAELMQLAEKRLSSNCIVDEINELLKQEYTLNAKIKSMEKSNQATNINVGDELYDNLKRAINDIPKKDKGDRNGNIVVFQALFQADSVIAHRCINNESDIVLSSDSDLAALAGKKCLGIKAYKFNERSKKGERLNNIVIYTPCSDLLLQVIDSINLQNNSTRIKRATFPIFENIEDINIRGLLAVGLGCDVNLPGVTSLGKATIEKFIKNEGELTYKSLIDFYFNFIYKKLNNSKTSQIYDGLSFTDENFKERFIDSINIYVDSFIYEPANTICDYIETEQIVAKYIPSNKPTKLHTYLKSFACDDPDIYIFSSNNVLLECVGTRGTGSHLFLNSEANYLCCFCSKTICKYCNIENDKDQKSCFDCYMEEVTVVPKNITNQPTLSKMRQILSTKGIETANGDNIGDISDLYDAVIQKEDFEIYTKSFIDELILLPLHPTNYLHSQKVLFRFDAFNGGSFIRHDLLTLNNKHDIICLLSKLVQTGSLELNKNIKENIYTILPDVIVEFARRSRVHSGYRLLKRAVRHAMDPDGWSILTCNCGIFNYKNTTGIHINHRIKASMKKDVYDVNVSFTSDDIIAASCTCKAGSSKDEKVICVHILPVLLQFSLLLYDGMAEHILVEIANDLLYEVEACLSKENLKNLKEAIVLLKRASGDINNDYLGKDFSLKELLNSYKVGTELSKKSPGPPNSKALGPLINLSFVSPVTAIGRIINETQKQNVSNVETLNLINEPIINNEINDIPYTTIQSLIQFIRHHFRNHSKRTTTLDECIGFRLVEYRSVVSGKILSTKTMNLLKKEMLVAINDACNEFRNVIHNKNVPSSQDNQNVVKDYFNDENNDKENISSAVVDNNINDKENNNNNEIILINNSTIKKVPIKRLTCCAVNCSSSSSKDASLIFRRVPKVPDKIKPEKASSNKTLLTYYRKKYARKEWMVRLGLPSHTPTQSLLICNKHELEKQLTEFKWKDNEMVEKLTSAKITLPRRQNEPPIKTRQQHSNRETVSFHPQPKKKTKTNDNTNQPTSSSIATTRARRYCVFKGCRFHNAEKNFKIRFCRVPSMPPALKDNASNYQILQYTKKIAYRKMFGKAINININDPRRDLRICDQHKIRNVSTIIQWNNKKGSIQSTKLTVDLPAEPSSKENPNLLTREANGLGIDRFICKKINEVKKKIETEDSESHQWAFALQQTCALNDGPVNVHHSVAEAVGITIHQKNDIKYQIYRDNNKTKEQTIVRLNLLNDDTIKSQTGFESKTTLLCYILIICNGCIKTMTTTTTKLTWWEEWYFFFEKCYGRSISRWIDGSDKYKRSESTLRVLYDAKMKIAIDCRNRWPKYVTLDEDSRFRGEQWNRTYAGKRVVMWDNTCIHLPKPQDPEAQRNTFSVYYAGNVGKGAIFIQLCGWMGTHDLWMGAVSDSEYFERSGILEQQSSYITAYDSSTADIQWIVILDKGYRVTSAAWRTGKQFVLQPSFAKSDQKFNTIETLRSAAVAHDRGANERAVRLSKMSKVLHDGRSGNDCIERLSDLWLTWSFQCNFMYKPVL